jgi:hypothetical protein
MSHRIFRVAEDVTAQLVGMSVTGGSTGPAENGGGILNLGSLTLLESAVEGNIADGVGGGIHTEGVLVARNSTISGNSAVNGGGIHVGSELGAGAADVVNSTISQNTATAGVGGGVRVWSGTAALTSVTVSGNVADSGSAIGLQPADGFAVIRSSVIHGECFDLQFGVVSQGHNIESPGSTCGLSQESDQVGLGTPELGLQPLQDNGGATATHALMPASSAIDRIPDEDCEVAQDQRGVLRPSGAACDVGAFELEQ